MSKDLNMKFLNKILFLFLFLSWAIPSESAELPYEKCNIQNQNYTEKLLKNSKKIDTEGCIDCLTKKDKKGLDSLAMSFFTNTNQKLNSIPAICFFASTLRSTEKKGSDNSKNYYFCKNHLSKNPTRTMTVFKDSKKKKKKKVWARRVCLSKDYIDTTVKSFNYMADCLGFSSLKEKKELFALFNHESSFIVNNRSNTGAKCYGQLTENTINIVDKFIYMKSKSHKPYLEIYNKALAKCPDLHEHIVLPDLLSKTGKKPSNIHLAKMQKKSDSTCRVSQHPSTCFFYAMYDIKANQIRFERNQVFVVNPLPQKVKDKEKLTKIFLLPIRQKEMLQVRGSFTKKSGEVVKKDWLFKDSLELYDTIKNLRYNPKQLQIKKINLYKNVEKIKLMATHTAHNGGLTILTNYFDHFLRNQKEQIAKKCTTKSKHCNYRKKLQKGQSLDYQSFEKDFSYFLSKKYKGTRKRKREVSNFYKNILDDINYLRNEENHLTNHLNQLHQNNPEISKKDINQFVNTAKEQCSDF